MKECVDKPNSVIDVKGTFTDLVADEIMAELDYRILNRQCLLISVFGIDFRAKVAPKLTGLGFGTRSLELD